MRFPRFLAGVFVLAANVFAADGKIDVSTIVDKAAAETVLGAAVKDPSPINVDGNDGYYSKCNYYTAKPGKVLIVRVYQAAPGYDAKQELEQVRASSGLTKSVSGLGDKAELFSGDVSGTSVNMTMIYVVKNNSLVTVGVRGLDEETAIARVKELAEKILASL